MSLHIEPTEEAVETLRKERRKNYIAALATSILSVVLAGAILYSLTIIIAAPEEPKVVGYITPDDAPPSDTPPPPEVQRETSSPSHAETPVKVVVAAAAAPVNLPKIDIDPPDEPVMLEEGNMLGMGIRTGPGRLHIRLRLQGTRRQHAGRHLLRYQADAGRPSHRPVTGTILLHSFPLREPGLE